jgi:hypothetical protein
MRAFVIPDSTLSAATGRPNSLASLLMRQTQCDIRALDHEFVCVAVTVAGMLNAKMCKHSARQRSIRDRFSQQMVSNGYASASRPPGVKSWN